MARRTVKVLIPENPDDALSLFKSVLDKNTLDGNDSPLKAINMALMQTLYNIAQASNDEMKRLYGLAEIETVKRDNAFGAAQNHETLYYILTQIRDLLLVLYKDNPKELEKWGFTVTIKESISRPKPKPPAAI